MKNFKNDLGRSMMEMLLYLGLVVVLTTSALNMYSTSVEKVRMIETSAQIDDIAEKVNLLYLGRPFSAGQDISIDEYLKNKLDDEIDFSTSWSNPLTITSNDGQTTVSLKPFFTIAFSGLKQKNCISVANLFSQKETFNITINGTTVSSIGDISVACLEENNTIKGSFYKN